MSLCLIVNPAAGSGRAGRALPAVRAELERLGLVHRVELTKDLPHARELSHDAAAAGETAVAFGGDGVIAAVAGAIRDTGGVLGVLPGGRGNDFARVLGLPLEPVAACRVLGHGTIRTLDLGAAGGCTFVGIASCGFDSDANRIANQARLTRGNLVYVYGAIRALLRWRTATFELRLDGGPPRRFAGYTVAAANSGMYGGGMRMAPDASLQDGLLDVVIVEDMPRLRFLRLLPTVFRGRHVRLRAVHVLRAREVEITADRPFTLYADGDPLTQLPTTVTALPRAVRVIVPA